MGYGVRDCESQNRSAQYPARVADPLDVELSDGRKSGQALRAHQRYWQQLKGLTRAAGQADDQHGHETDRLTEQGGGNRRPEEPSCPPNR